MVPCSSEKSLRIRVDNKDIVSRRCHREGQKQVLQGDITFYTPRPTTIKSVKVILKGTRKVSWLTDSLQPQYVEQKEYTLYQEQKLHVFVKSAAQASRAGPGLYSWPFAFTFGGDLPESVDWLPHDSYISYTLTAEVATGMLWNTTSTTENLRFVKSPSFWADDLYFAPEFRELAFPSGQTCQITFLQPYQPADGQLDLDFALKGNQSTAISIESIALDLFQITHLAVTKDGKPWSANRSERRIMSTTKKPNDITAPLKDVSTEGGRATSRFFLPLQLPLAPYTCVQSVEDEKLKVRYKLRVTVCVRDAEEKICEQSVDLFPKLFAPIHTRRETRLAPIRVDSVADSRGIESPLEGSFVCDSGMVLPLYGEHVFDALYDGDVCLSPDDILTFGGAGVRIS